MKNLYPTAPPRLLLYVCAGEKAADLDEYDEHGCHLISAASRGQRIIINKLTPQITILCQVYLLLSFFLFHFVVPIGIYPVGNSGRFPQGKPAATESRDPALTN